MKFEDVTPNPEYLIKSIAEQGYSLESALADLMDNSISANADKIEMIIKMDHEPFVLFLADNGDGMDEETLKSNMHFPSNSPDNSRNISDLGRFGLGMKTASFSQTRKFTVISKEKGSSKYAGRTWDLNFLQDNKWNLLVNTNKEIEILVSKYKEQSKDHLNSYDDFEANTIIIWYGLYKYEEYLEEKNRKTALKREITEVTADHLSMVFHRFLEKAGTPLQIRINNDLLKPFNPFPTEEKDFRSVEFKQKSFGNDSIKLEGFILPSRSIDETKESIFTQWATKHRSLIDMEGIYIYRANRIILFGGWNGIIKKVPRLQLARLRVEIGNSVDHLLHLNVAKSQVIIPHDLKDAFETYINELKDEAKKEFYNRGLAKLPAKKENKISLFEKKFSNKGALLELNDGFPIIKLLRNNLSASDLSNLNVLIKMVNTEMNKVRQVGEQREFMNFTEQDGLSFEDLKTCVTELLKSGLDPQILKQKILPSLGFEQNSLPDEIYIMLKEG